jgi:hypothetical protein
MQQRFLHKKVKAKVQERDNKGKLIPNTYTTVVGVCDFIGSNEILKWPLYVVIDRSTFVLKHINDIELYDSK